MVACDRARTRGWCRIDPDRGRPSLGGPLETLIDLDELVSQTRWYPLVDAGFVLGFVSVLPATLSVVARFRAGLVERQQIKWLLAATSVLALAYLAGAISDDSSEAAWWAVSLGVAAIPIAILFAVLRYRLYDIDRILSRTVSYVIRDRSSRGHLCTGCDRADLGPGYGIPIGRGRFYLAVAALFNPLRRRVQAGVDRRFNRSHYDAQQVMDQFLRLLAPGPRPGHGRRRLGGSGVRDDAPDIDFGMGS